MRSAFGSMNSPRHWLAAAFVAGLVLGLWHLVVAFDAVTVFGSSEPVAWIALGLGPGITLPATVLARLRPMLGGEVLIVAGALSTITFVAGMEPGPEGIGFFIAWFTVPMAALGAAFVALGGWERHASRHGEEI